MQIDYPYHIARNGRTAQTGTDEHIRDLIEQVLFTVPGERVNRPTFGCGLMQMVFGPNSPEIATATQFIVQSSLQQWLGELIQVNQVDVQSEDFDPARQRRLYRTPFASIKHNLASPLCAKRDRRACTTGRAAGLRLDDGLEVNFHRIRLGERNPDEMNVTSRARHSSHPQVCGARAEMEKTMIKRSAEQQLADKLERRAQWATELERWFVGAATIQ